MAGAESSASERVIEVIPSFCLSGKPSALVSLERPGAQRLMMDCIAKASKSSRPMCLSNPIREARRGRQGEIGCRYRT